MITHAIYLPGNQPDGQPVRRPILAALGVCLSLVGCADDASSLGSQSEPLTRGQCIEYPGVVVGDPGDGSVLSPEYLCADGQPPVGEVVPLSTDPVATEGEVCCATPEQADGDGSPDDGLTRQQCLEYPGVVVGDPGDGSVLSKQYRCEDGEPALAVVVPLPGEPVATEGEVCCGTVGPADE